MTKFDYITFYAKKLLENPALFEQQKMIIDSQIKASRSIFANKFGKNFKQNARKYLKEIKLI